MIASVCKVMSSELEALVEQKSREEYAQKSDTIRRDVAAPVSEEPAVETEADDNPVDDDDAPVVDFGD